MKHLVLGSAGQVGASLTSYLRKQSVSVIEFDMVNSPEQDLRRRDNDLLERSVSESDFVYFLAFDVGGSMYFKKYQHSHKFIANNVKIMDNTFGMLQKYGKPFIFMSSQMSNMSDSPYGVLKALGEHYTRSLGGLIVKLWNVYGIEQDLDKAHVITDFVLNAKRQGKIRMLTDGSEERQFLFADDCSEGLLCLSKHYGEIPREQELHLTSYCWTKIIDVAQVVAEYFDGIRIIPAETQDDLQQGRKNEPDQFILKFWMPKTSLSDGIGQIVKYYEARGYPKKCI